MPLIAGPAAWRYCCCWLPGEPDRLGVWSIALLLAWAASAVILLTAPQLKHILGQRGLIATERLMGMLLVAIAVQMFLEGIAQFLGRSFIEGCFA